MQSSVNAKLSAEKRRGTVTESAVVLMMAPERQERRRSWTQCAQATPKVTEPRLMSDKNQMCKPEEQSLSSVQAAVFSGRAESPDDLWT